ncbi:hypothetical protein AB834_03775 [PVC group bacterium (ex Bugula neritina AB1)]|nr:hypothetical protein AB834_03775 [PVC group bacterium (ex Bugula neritina AB1)]
MIYNTNIFNKFIKTFLRDGKYTKSSKIFYELLFRLYKFKRKDPNFIVLTALFNISPLTKVSSKERSNLLLNADQSLCIAFRYLSRMKRQPNKKSNYNMVISEELIKAYGKGKQTLPNSYWEDIIKS